MASFPYAATSVIQGMAAPIWAGLQGLPRPLPKFRLVPATRPIEIVIPLSTVVKEEVIPRLALAHSVAVQVDPAPVGAWVSPEAFTRTLLDRDGDAPGAFVAAALHEGADLELLYDDLLGPTAILLADMWREDRLSYADVTIGLARLQRLVRGMPRETAYNGENDDMARCALFAPRPGEQQTFGFFMIEERFRWGGWRTWLEKTSTREELVADVSGRWFDMVCLSVSRTDNLPELSGVITAIRRASRNRGVVTAVDGAPSDGPSDWVSIIGADAVVSSEGAVTHRAAVEPRLLATA